MTHPPARSDRAPTAALVYLLICVATAAAVLSSIAAHFVFEVADLEHSALLIVLAVGFEEVSAQVARRRIRFGSNLAPDLTSVWSFGAAVALPRGWAIIVVCAILAHVWQRQDRPAGFPAYRSLFNATNVVLSCLIAGTSFDVFVSQSAKLPAGLDKALPVLGALAVYAVANRSLVTGFLVCRRVPVHDLLGTRDDNLVEFATLCLGGLAALALRGEPWLVLLVIAPLVALQRGARIREFEAAATTDTKTGLLNAVAWEHTATLELARATRTSGQLAVLMIDIDRFKPVNDRYGHLAGDLVLKAVGQSLGAGVRDYDTVGRFGGEEFIAVLPDADDAGALVIAERLRSRIEALSMRSVIDIGPGENDVLTVSIGVASFGSDGQELPELLHAADQALYTAKALGRNRVQLAYRGQGNLSDSVPSR